VAQLALAVTLVTIGGLVVRTASAISAAPTGFDTDGLLVFALSFDDRRHPEMPVRRQIVADIESRLRRAGVDVSAGALESWPAINVEPAAPIAIDAFASAETDPAIWAHVVAVDSQALTTLGIPLLDGRALTESDVARDAPVALISAEAATRYFGGVSMAIGRRLHTRLGGVTRERQIVGVTGDVRNVEPERGMPPRVWVPLAEPRNVAFVVRTRGDLQALAGSVRQTVREVAAGTPIESLESYEQGIARVVGSDRVVMGMLVTFAGLALLFAATGLYGIVAYSVSQRRAEFGTRFALGARVSDVAGLVVGHAFKLLLAGLALGLAGGLVVANAMRGMLYGVTPLDPLNVGVVIAVLAMVTVVASLVPALRAARVDVVQAIRAE
jgi:predicted permease